MAWRKPSNLREWFRVLFRHKKKFAFPAMLVMIVAVIGSFWVPRKYEAEARFQRSNDAALRQMGNATISGNLNVFRRKVKQDITSRDSIEQLTKDLDLTKGFARDRNDQLTRQGQVEKEDLIRKIRHSISVSYEIRNDQVDQIVVGYTDTDRNLAPKVANQLVQNYIAQTRKEMDKMLLGAQEFFGREVTKFSARVLELQTKKMKFELDHPGLDPNNPLNIHNQLTDLQATEGQIEKDVEVKEGKRRELTQWMDEQPEFVEEQNEGPNPQRTRLEDRRQKHYEDLDYSLTVLMRTEEHPAVKKLRKRIAELDKQIEALPETVSLGTVRKPNEGRLGVEAQIRELDGEIEALNDQKERLTLKIQQLEIQNRNYFQVRNEYLNLDRDLLDSAEQLKFWESNLQRTQVALQTEISQRGVRLRQIERAEDMPRPSQPTLVMILGMASVLGLGTGFASLIMAELMDHTFQSVEQAVDELKLPVLGAVNEIVTPAEGFKRRILSWGVYPAVTTALVGVLLCSLFATYLNLRQPLTFDRMKANPALYVKQLVFGGH